MRLGKITISGLQEWMDSWYDPTPWPKCFGVMAEERRLEHEAWLAALESRLLSGRLMAGPGQDDIPPAYSLEDPSKLVEWLDEQTQKQTINRDPVVVI